MSWIVCGRERFGRILQVFAGLGFWASLSWVFDNIAYPLMIAWLGFIRGGLVMTALSVLIEFLFLLVYEKQQTDWMGMDFVRDMRDKGGLWIERSEKLRHRNRFVDSLMRIALFFPITFFRIIVWMLNRGSVFVFLVLSIATAPFPTTIYFREGRFDGLGRRDYVIFAASAVVGNVYWSLRSYGVVVIVEYLWGLFV